MRDAFLISGPYGLYSLKGDYDTQRKVERHFVGMHDENSIWIRDGLYRLISNVLFVEDPRQPEMYHPRIGVYNARGFGQYAYDGVCRGFGHVARLCGFCA